MLISKELLIICTNQKLYTCNNINVVRPGDVKAVHSDTLTHENDLTVHSL